MHSSNPPSHDATPGAVAPLIPPLSALRRMQVLKSHQTLHFATEPCDSRHGSSSVVAAPAAASLVSSLVATGSSESAAGHASPRERPPSPLSSSSPQRGTSQPHVSKSLEQLLLRSFEPSSPSDRARLQALDRLCTQGIATQLISEFPLEIPFEHFQTEGETIVALDSSSSSPTHPAPSESEFVAILRSFCKSVYLNGIPVYSSYHFLRRTHPNYRRHGIMAQLAQKLIKNDVKRGVRLISGYIVVDNLASQNLTVKDEKLFASSGNGVDSEAIDTFNHFALHLTEANHRALTLQAEAAITASLSTFFVSPDTSLKVQYSKLPSGSHEIGKVCMAFAKSQFMPAQLDRLLSLDLHLGTYVARVANHEAGLLVWNSGKIRRSYLKSDAGAAPPTSSALLYNIWNDGTAVGKSLSLGLIAHVARLLQADGFQSVSIFDSQQSNLDLAFLRPMLYMNVAWRFSVWYLHVDGKTRLCDRTFSSRVFYDPRDSLI